MTSSDVAGDLHGASEDAPVEVREEVQEELMYGKFKASWAV